jgi:hypothetical protein
METGLCFQDREIFLEELIHQISYWFDSLLCGALEPSTHYAIEVDRQAQLFPNVGTNSTALTLIVLP